MNNYNRYTLYIQNIADIIALSISFWVAKFLKFNVSFFNGNNFMPEAYTRLFLIMIIAYVVIDIFLLTKENFLLRDNFEELFSCIKLSVLIVLVFLIYVFFWKISITYSRGFFLIFLALSTFFVFIFRILIKQKILPMYQSSNQAKKVVLVGPKENVSRFINTIKNSGDWRYNLSGVIVTDEDLMDVYLEQLPVIGNRETMFEAVASGEVDSVFILPDSIDREVEEWTRNFCDLGKTTHINVDHSDILSDFAQITDEIAGSTMISYLPLIPIPQRQLAIKKVIDYVLALVLLPLYLVVYILSFVFMNLESRGPIIHSRVRVGKNGRRYYQYRFRMLRMDAEERRKNKKTPFTRFGLFLRATHLDGLPMILNVLAGDMSFVGPHSPTFSSFIDYSKERRKNLSIQPGIVGYWTFIKSKKKIINTERNYIESWNILKDIEVLYNVIIRYVTFNSPKKYIMLRYNEEVSFINEYLKFKEPLEYDHSLYKAKSGPLEFIYLFIKRCIDIVLSLLAIIILSPVFLILMILVVADDGGSPFYGHERIGKNGKRIKVYKFRSMKKDAGDLEQLLTPEQLEQYKREFKIDNDPRITRIGQILRTTSLDELPQLFNILGGSLSIVGPRPIVEKETLVYGKDIGKFLSVKPGLTGYWQAYARNNATYESGERQQMEMYYVDHHSLILDIKIVFKTFTSVLKREGAQ